MSIEDDGWWGCWKVWRGWPVKLLEKILGEEMDFKMGLLGALVFGLLGAGVEGA
jgi:hypothetical protein